MLRRKFPFLLLSFLIAAVVLALTGLSSLHGGEPSGSPFRLLWDPGERVLVFAPHPDDETLAAAGVIRRCLEEGGVARVVIVTDGGRFVRAAQVLAGRRNVGPADFRRLAVVRRREARAAAAALGLENREVEFLGYPDRGLARLWRRRDPALVHRLARIVRDFAPTDVYYPAAFDEHPDHAALSCFVRAALAEARLPVREHQYLVHYRRNTWPEGGVFAVAGPLLPPDDLNLAGARWEFFPLGEEELLAKAAAVAAYRSQLRVTGSRMLAFVRLNELFLAPEGYPLQRGLLSEKKPTRTRPAIKPPTWAHQATGLTARP